MPGSTDANGQFVRVLRAGEHGWYPIGAFDPQVRGVEHVRTSPQAMENLAEKPLAGVGASTLGQILRATPAGQFGDFCGFGNTGVVFPKPRHRGRVFGESAIQSQWPPVASYGQRRAAGGIHPDADDLAGLETTGGAPG